LAQFVANHIAAVLEVEARDAVLLSVVSHCSVTGKVVLVFSELWTFRTFVSWYYTECVCGGC